jgi:hypothetical protein
VSVVDESPESIREQAEGICFHEGLRKCVKQVVWKPNVRALPQTALEFALESGEKLEKPYNLFMYRFMNEIMRMYLRNCPNLSRVAVLHYLTRTDDHAAFDEIRPPNQLMFWPLFEAYSRQLGEFSAHMLTEGDLTINRQYSSAETARLNKWDSLQKLHLCFRTPDQSEGYEAKRIPWILQQFPTLKDLSLAFQAGPSGTRTGTGNYVRMWDAENWISLRIPHLKFLTLSGLYVAVEPLRHLLFDTTSTFQSVCFDDLWLRDGQWSEVFDSLDQLSLRVVHVAKVGYQRGDTGQPRLPEPATEQDHSSWWRLRENTNNRRQRLGLEPLPEAGQGGRPPDVPRRTI